MPNITVLELSWNFGKEAALSAGIDAAAVDAVIPIDADLQHPPELIIDMIRKWEGVGITRFRLWEARQWQHRRLIRAIGHFPVLPDE